MPTLVLSVAVIIIASKYTDKFFRLELWKESYGEETKTQSTSLEERLQKRQKGVAERQAQQRYKSKDRGAR